MHGHAAAAALFLFATAVPVARGFSYTSHLPLSHQADTRWSESTTSPACLRRRVAPRRHAPETRMLVDFIVADAAVGFVGKSVIIGGALAGGLHAVSGPDHFPALLPRCMGQRAWPAAKIGERTHSTHRKHIWVREPTHTHTQYRFGVWGTQCQRWP
jgi:hypothetical protein